ncbi:MAG: hypothetical protein K2X93_12460 [Candidatus Obscuribacterales bacterium]|nr:hypothetical protein [Candidatus Obscuribacterales bacterium]
MNPQPHKRLMIARVEFDALVVRLKAGISSAVTLLLLIMPVLSVEFHQAGAVEARGKKHSNASRAKPQARSKKSSSRGNTSERKARGGRKSIRVERRGGRRSSREEKRGRQSRKSEPPKPKAVLKPPPPSPELVAANRRRESSYQTMGQAYRLYDQGINLRMARDYVQAVDKLSQSGRLFDDIRGYQRNGEASLAETMVHYELGQAAEGQGDYLTARDSYFRCLNIRPSLVEASIRLVNLLASTGQWQLAIAKAQEAVRSNPQDPRAHMLMALILSKSGHPQEAQNESAQAKQLLRVVPKYKPMGIDAVWRRTHNPDGSLKQPGVVEPADAQPEAGSHFNKPEEIMGDTTEETVEDEEAEDDPKQ